MAETQKALDAAWEKEAKRIEGQINRQRTKAAKEKIAKRGAQKLARQAAQQGIRGKALATAARGLGFATSAGGSMLLSALALPAATFGIMALNEPGRRKRVDEQQTAVAKAVDKQTPSYMKNIKEGQSPTDIMRRNLQGRVTGPVSRAEARRGMSDIEKNLVAKAREAIGRPIPQEGSSSGKVIRGTYTIQKGDTLSQIAKAAGMTLPQIKAMNPEITDYNKISAGQKIKVEKGNARSPYEGMSKSEMAKMSKGSKAKTTSKKRGGKVGKPRGVGAAIRGYGKAMKGGK
jgi:LysM repeat protein